MLPKSALWLLFRGDADMNLGMGGLGSIDNQGVLAAALAGLCLLIGIALSIAALRQIAAARKAMCSARFLRELLEAGPARALLVQPDGSVELDEALARDLGVAPRLPSLHALGEAARGIEAEDAERLAAMLRPAILAGERIDLALRIKGSARLVDVRGARRRTASVLERRCCGFPTAAMQRPSGAKWPLVLQAPNRRWAH